MTTTQDTAGRLTVFALRTDDAAWIDRNADIPADEDGRTFLYLPADEVEHFERMGQPWLRHTFTDVPSDALNATISCPASWLV